MLLTKILKRKSIGMAVDRLIRAQSILNPNRQYNSVKQGSKYSTSFRQYLELPNGEIGSYFHDVPLELNGSNRTVNMVVEVPRWSNAKFEISKEIDFNPIVQDTKKGKVRFVHNIFPFHGYIHNYGALPQTWEDPNQTGVEALKGDNDPLDCCEIGSSILNTGEVLKVKILGSLALIDDGELDWKVIAINVNDPLACHLENLGDVEKHLPGILSATREWFRNYKIPAGKPANRFAFSESYKDATDTIATILECNAAWKKLIDGSSSDATDGQPRTRRAGTGVHLNSDMRPPVEIPFEVNKWSYI